MGVARLTREKLVLVSEPILTKNYRDATLLFFKKIGALSVYNLLVGRRRRADSERLDLPVRRLHSALVVEWSLF